MANPTRDTTAGRVCNDRRNLARRTSRSTDEVMVEYVLERFLHRLAASPLGREHFVLQGGLLLAKFGARRMTSRPSPSARRTSTTAYACQ